MGSFWIYFLLISLKLCTTMSREIRDLNCAKDIENYLKTIKILHIIDNIFSTTPWYLELDVVI